MKKYLYLIFCLSFASCYVLPQKNKLYQSYGLVDLGVIGKQKKSVRKTGYEIIGIPEYKENIKLKVTLKKIDKQNFKSYSEYTKSTSSKELITYNDSIKVIPNYVEVQISDKIAIVKALNTGNSEILNYLVKNPEVSIVTKLKFVANTKTLKNIQESDTYYLKTLHDKQSFILMYKGNKLIDKINTAVLQVFQYDVSSLCWEVSERKQTKIVGVVKEGELCKNGTVRNPNKEINRKIKKFDF
ncbi:hypothetical protein [Tenacibaculum amylolyticum]|uniref:hypothetical protein n=1 Tax=Tenacibaculum amylolyticum TaxID=104269 RepID=UPI003894FF5A